ncbi:MAG: GNAT family N-acetyltransferase [Planctomycetota bacterium]
MPVEIIDADYRDPQHAEHLAALLDAYACDPMGGGMPLPDEVKQRLVQDLADRPDAFSTLAYVDGEPAGLINCFEGYSTFKAKPLINIHDVVVLPGFRGQRLAHRMLERVEAIARERGCCKLTLEVLTGNVVAQGVYKRFGFDGYELDAETGQAQFWQKPL